MKPGVRGFDRAAGSGDGRGGGSGRDTGDSTGHFPTANETWVIIDVEWDPSGTTI